MRGQDTTRRGLGAIAAGAAIIAVPQTSASSALNPPLQALRRQLDIKDFGAKGDGATDDTAAFRRAIQSVADAGGGSILVPAGHYVLAADFASGERSDQNSLLPLPYRQAFQDEMIVIRLVGETNAYAFAPPFPHTGSIISTPNKGTVSNGLTSSIIGLGASQRSNQSFSAVTLFIENITFVVGPNSNIVAIDASAIQNCILRDVAAVVGVTPGSEPEPKDPRFTAIKLPATGNYGIVKCLNVYVEGFYYGIEHSEHADIDALINQCEAAIHIPHSYSHLSRYNITSQRCKYSIWCDGLASTSFPYSNVIWGTLDIERDPQFPFEADFHVAEGAILNGILFYNVAADPESLYSVTGGGRFGVIVQNCAAPSKRVSADARISCNGWFFPVIPDDLSTPITLTVIDGTTVGQRLRVYGSAQFDVTVRALEHRDDKHFRFPDGSARSAHAIRAGADGGYLELMWAGGHWLASACGEAKSAAPPDDSLSPAGAGGQRETHLQTESGKAIRNDRAFSITIYVPLEFRPTSTEAANAKLFVGADPSSLGLVWIKQIPAGSPTGAFDTATVTVPAGWYFRIDTQNASIYGEATAYF